MKKQFNSLRVRQLDQTLDRFRDLIGLDRPPGGWLRSVRKALGMTTSQLAERLSVSQSAISKYERSEREQTITLKTLRRVASALDCELAYAVVPRIPIRERREKRAREVARRRIESVQHSMELEDQAISEEEKRRQIEGLTQELLDEWPRTIWDRQ